MSMWKKKGLKINAIIAAISLLGVCGLGCGKVLATSTENTAVSASTTDQNQNSKRRIYKLGAQKMSLVDGQNNLLSDYVTVDYLRASDGDANGNVVIRTWTEGKDKSSPFYKSLDDEKKEKPCENWAIEARLYEKNDNGTEGEKVQEIKSGCMNYFMKTPNENEFYGAAIDNPDVSFKCYKFVTTKYRVKLGKTYVLKFFKRFFEVDKETGQRNYKRDEMIAKCDWASRAPEKSDDVEKYVTDFQANPEMKNYRLMSADGKQYFDDMINFFIIKDKLEAITKDKNDPGFFIKYFINGYKNDKLDLLKNYVNKKLVMNVVDSEGKVLVSSDFVVAEMPETKGMGYLAANEVSAPQSVWEKCVKILLYDKEKADKDKPIASFNLVDDKGKSNVKAAIDALKAEEVYSLSFPTIWDHLF